MPPTGTFPTDVTEKTPVLNGTVAGPLTTGTAETGFEPELVVVPAVGTVVGSGVKVWPAPWSQRSWRRS